MASLYRKYRPQRFSDLVGQAHVADTLRYALTHDAVGHAYLFCGPRGVGKTTIARIVAKAVNCTALKDGEPCLKCANCEAIAAGNFLDLIEIDAASNRGIDEIRTLKENVRFHPQSGARKVFVIDEVHMLTKEAFNALLKTLEEPPAQVLFVLATTEPHKLPATIISRVQRFDFHRLTQDEITPHLLDIAKHEKLKLDAEAAAILAQNADGSSRDSLSALEQMAAFAQGKKITVALIQEALGVPAMESIFDLMDALLAADTTKALAQVAVLASTGVDMSVFVAHLTEYLRKILLAVAAGEKTSDAAVLSAEQEARFAKHVSQLSVEKVMRWIGLLLDAKRREKMSPLPQLPLELAIIEMTNPGVSAAVPVAAAPVATVQTSTARTVTITAPVAAAPTPPVAPVVLPKKPVKKPVVRTITPQELVNVEPVDPAALKMSLEEVLGKWHEALLQLREKNYTLAGMLRGGWPVEMSGGRVVLAFKHAFHKEHMNQIANRHALEEILEQKLGSKVLVSCILEEELTEDQKKQLAKREEVLAKAQAELEKTALSIFEGSVEGGETTSAQSAEQPAQ